MTTKIIVEMDEDLLKAIDNKIKLGDFNDRDEAINKCVKYYTLVVVK